jgi:hypothetical protein
MKLVVESHLSNAEVRIIIVVGDKDILEMTEEELDAFEGLFSSTTSIFERLKHLYECVKSMESRQGISHD